MYSISNGYKQWHNKPINLNYKSKGYHNHKAANIIIEIQNIEIKVP